MSDIVDQPIRFFFIKTHTTVALLIFQTILQLKIALRHGSEIILEYS